MELKNDPKNYYHLVAWLIGFLIVFFFLFSYVYTEVMTKFYLSEITNSQDLCEIKTNPDLKYIKVLDYQKNRRNAKIICIYGDSSKNLQLDLSNTGDNWEEYFSIKLNKERHLYWPIYI